MAAPCERRPPCRPEAERHGVRHGEDDQDELGEEKGVGGVFLRLDAEQRNAGDDRKGQTADRERQEQARGVGERYRLAEAEDARVERGDANRPEARSRGCAPR